MRTLITGGNLVDVRAAETVEDGYLLVEGTRIREVGRGRYAGEADRVVRADGRWIVPGFIDLHVHFLGSSQTAKWTTVQKTLYGVEQGRRALDAGITTARDVGAKERSIFELRSHFADGRLDGPRMLACGAMICMTGGHGSPFNSRECDGVDEVRKGTREQLRAGADWIKLSATGGAATANEEITSSQLDPEEMLMVVHEASKAGKSVCAHAHATSGIAEAVRAGVRTIEHGVFIDDDTAALMRERGAWLVPTLSAYVAIVEQGDKFGIPKYMTDKAAEVTRHQKESTARAFAAGVPIAFGTDAAGPYNPIGRSVMREAELMADCGMGLGEILAAATTGAADALRIGEETGSLEAGKDADVLLLGSDPLASTAAYGRVELVMRAGSVRRE